MDANGYEIEYAQFVPAIVGHHRNGLSPSQIYTALLRENPSVYGWPSVQMIKYILRRAEGPGSVRGHCHNLLRGKLDDIENMAHQILDMVAALKDGQWEGSGTPLDLVELSCRSRNCLKYGGYETVQDVADAPDSELLRLPNFGRKSLKEVREVCRP